MAFSMAPEVLQKMAFVRIILECEIKEDFSLKVNWTIQQPVVMIANVDEWTQKRQYHGSTPITWTWHLAETWCWRGDTLVQCQPSGVQRGALFMSAPGSCVISSFHYSNSPGKDSFLPFSPVLDKTLCKVKKLDTSSFSIFWRLFPILCPKLY